MNPALGIGLKIASTLAFALMSAGVRALAETFPVGQLAFCRSFFAMIPLFALVIWRGEVLAMIVTNRLMGHVLRGSAGVAGMFLGFLGLAYLPLADAVAINYTVPLMVVPMAALFLGEVVRAYRWSAVAVGFFGVLVMLSPHLSAGADGSLTGALYALSGAASAAVATILVRRLMGTESTWSIVFYFSLVTTLAGLATAPFGWVMPDVKQALMLVGIGIAGGIGQMLMTESFRHADASVIAPFDYTSMLWAVLLGLVMFGEVPQLMVLVGAGIVIAAGLFILWRERRLGLLARAERKGPEA